MSNTLLSGEANEDPLHPHCKYSILTAFWPKGVATLVPVTADQECPWDAYFRHYTTECRNAIDPDRGEHVTIRHHQDIVDIVKQFEQNKTREEIKRSIILTDTQQTSEAVKEKRAEGSIRVVARLFAMVNMGPSSERWELGPESRPWNEANHNLKTVLARYFSPSSVDTGSLRFKADLTAFNLKHLIGLKILWTNNLFDHLRLMDDDSTVCIFHHATFLRHQTSDVFPENLISETLKTLDLLFPQRNTRTQTWLKSLLSRNNEPHPDVSLLHRNKILYGQRHAMEFVYWRDRLLILKEVLEEAHHTSIRYFWHDRRNKAQWYTFWIAVIVLCLTAVFGLLQSIAGILQVYKAYRPTPK
ncbi:hypothetical protein BKA58DRAFT_462854 [Alternaria rosae]|uniref:uncharacterized protein n=1 Tax=Alternaria rosae TaxID=1187941 RepID=UPI001E8CBA58|nr:uncharacterized protein BKA58DRAFT_462854 [Alternaria rosae]KAH6865202.1 hypothetical protein BKA58DRAFT_462854 [Alternaria rosae]